MQLEMCLFSSATRFLLIVYGTLGPAYQTYKTLNSGDEEFLAWAKYWIVYAFLICFEVVSDILLSWIPLYTPTKLLIVLGIVLSAPTTNVWMFDTIVRPVLSKRQEQIDNFLDRGKNRVILDILNKTTFLIFNSRTIVQPLFQMWSEWKRKANPAEDVAIPPTINDCDSAHSSEQTSGHNLSIGSSPVGSFTAITNDSDAFQLNACRASTQLHVGRQHSAHLLQDLSKKCAVPVGVRGRMSRRSPTEVQSVSEIPSAANLPKDTDSVDEVEQFLEKSRHEIPSLDAGAKPRQTISIRRRLAPTSQ